MEVLLAVRECDHTALSPPDVQVYAAPHNSVIALFVLMNFS